MELIRYGLDVNQCNFKEFCRMMRYKRYYTFMGKSMRFIVLTQGNNRYKIKEM